MAKFTLKFVRDELSNQFIDLSPEALEVSTMKKSKSSGKKVKVVDKEATRINIEHWLLFYAGTLETLSIFEAKFPDGLDEIVNGYRAEWEALRAYYEENYPDEYAEFSEAYSIYSYEDTDDADEDDAADDDNVIDYSALSLGELRKECKTRGLKYTPKHKEDDLIAMLEEDDAADAAADEPDDEDEPEEEPDEESYDDMSLGDLRKLAKERGIKYSPKTKKEDLVAALEEWDEENADASDEDEDEPDEEESDEDEAPAYEDMSLGELRKECKARGIKYTPKHKAEDLVAMLEEDDSATDEDDSDDQDESGDEDEDEISEEDLDEVLDEEFEDETLEEEEKKSPNKGKKLPPKPKKK